MDMNLIDEMIFDLHTKHKIGLNGVDVKCWKDIKKYIDDKNVLLEMIEQITNTLNVSVDGVSYLKDVLKDKEKLIEELKLELKTANGYVDDVNDNLAEIVEYRVSERMGEDYLGDEKSEIGILKNDIECLEREMKSFENYLTEKNCWYLLKDWKDIYEKFGRMVDFDNGMLEKYERNLRFYRLDRSKGD